MDCDAPATPVRQHMAIMESLIVVARLKPGAEEEARELVAQGPPFDLAATDLARHSVYVSGDEVIFLFEGPGAEAVVESFVNDPVTSASFAVWGRLVEGTPHAARREFDWPAPE